MSGSLFDVIYKYAINRHFLKMMCFFIEFRAVYLQKTTAMNLNIKDEVSPLKAVVLGQLRSLGPVPEIHQVFDAKSYETILEGTYPTEEAVYKEMKVLLRRCCSVTMFRFFVRGRSKTVIRYLPAMWLL